MKVSSIFIKILICFLLRYDLVLLMIRIFHLQNTAFMQMLRNIRLFCRAPNFHLRLKEMFGRQKKKGEGRRNGTVLFKFIVLIS